MGSCDVDQFAQERGKQPLDERKTGGVRGDSISQEDIRQIQQKLIQAGFDPGPTDGHLGPQTRKAIRDYQKTHRLRQTGTLNKDTYNLLMGSSPP
jgi:peptidoglycan hydrolase-like protein with peptidoglycan-binding domain